MRLGGGDRPSPPPIQKRSIWSRAPLGQGLADGGCVGALLGDGHKTPDRKLVQIEDRPVVWDIVKWV